MVAQNKGNTKELFRVVNKLLGKTAATPLPANKSPAELAGMFSDFFVQKIVKIRNSICTDSPVPNVPSNATHCSFLTFESVTIEQVRKLITGSPNKTCDLDPIPTSLVKQEVDSLAPIITAIINKSLACGEFPHTYKSAIVSPLLKKMSLDPEELKNYRPVSNLAFVSKLIEKVVASQLTTYLTNNNLTEVFQSAYRQNHSTETALLCVYNDVICAIGQQKAVLLVLLDLSAAFDTVDYSCLLHTLQQLGIEGTAWQWFNSYLKGRSQTIRINGVKSDPAMLDCGVPQGSVLGPVLFTIYTSSLGALLRHNCIDYHLYADDSQLYVSCKVQDINNTIARMESCLLLVQAWMSHHHLKMNNDKTEVLLISSKPMSKKLHVPSLQVSNHSINLTSSAKCIGVVMDSYISMEAHISSVCRTAYHQLRNISQLKRYLDSESLECMVHAFVTTKLDYCNSLFAGLPSSQINRLQSVQNTAARILTNTHKYDNITPVLHSLHWLPIYQRIKFKTLVIIYKTLNNLAPRYLEDLIDPYTPSRTLRSSHQSYIRVPFTNSNLVKNCAFSVNGPASWNTLPEDIRFAETITIFKSKLKTYLFKEHFT